MSGNYSNISFEPGRMNLRNYAQEQEAYERAEAERQFRESEQLAREKTIPSAVLAEFYEYQRIDDVWSSRLLVLDPGDKATKLTGRLEGFSVGEPQTTHPYKALSYVWGEPVFSDIIMIEGKRLAITKSLGVALRRLRPPSGKTPLRIWIDQICINQHDTVERSQQVRLMHSIFRHASQVLVWLGEDPEGHAPRAFQLTQSLQSIFGDKLLSKLCKDQGPSFDWIPAEYWRSLRELTRQPWFRRVWIPQEIGTDADAMIHWGGENIGWIALEGAMRRLETEGWELKKKHKIDTSVVTILFRRFADSLEDGGSTSKPERRSFVYQLCLSARNIATDPRDYVFSRLGHPSAWIESERAMIIQPDYKNTVADVYHEIAIRALTTDSTLMVLNAVSDDGAERAPLVGHQLPTWAPRWDAGRLGSVIGYPGRYKASGGRKSNISSASFDNRYKTLRVKGFVIDTIDRATPRFAYNSFSAGSSKNAQIQTAWGLCQSATKPPSKPPSKDRRKDKDKPISAPFTTQGTYQPDPDYSLLQAFLESLAPTARLTQPTSKPSTPSKTTSSSPPPVPDDTDASYYAGITALTKLFPTSSAFTHKHHDPRKLLTDPTAAPSEGSLDVTAWIRAAEEHAVGRTFGVTREWAYFALLPPTARPGDKLCVLLGGETPYVLRVHPQDEDKYVFVGESYVPGLMEDGAGLFGPGAEVTTLRVE